VINHVCRVSGKGICQRNYYEHIIRGGGDLARIRNYIAANPSRWEIDEENPHRRIAGRLQEW
jgi:REP element-mobilizing transposase RayT